MNWAFDDIILLHIQTLFLLKMKDYERACNTQTNVINKEF